MIHKMSTLLQVEVFGAVAIRPRNSLSRTKKKTEETHVLFKTFVPKKKKNAEVFGNSASTTSLCQCQRRGFK